MTFNVYKIIEYTYIVELQSLLMRVKVKKTWLKTEHSKQLRSLHPVPSLHAIYKGESGNSDILYFVGL